tara:strand:+ start:824 stop:1783 length:960 start_codon:yes stop_codon:yes gene_type:complete
MANGGIIGPVQEPTIGDVVTPFTSPGTFVAKKTQNVGLLVVAGGGGGGHRTQWNGSGGGAGGFRLFPAHPVTAGQPVSVTIGAGGTGQSLNGQPFTTSQGDDTSFGPISATGGGSGVGSGLEGQPNFPNTNSLDGGAGGGVGDTSNNPYMGNGNVGGYSPSEGSNGGLSNGPSSPGGGGGFTNQGGFGNPSSSGPGGEGTNATPVFGSAPQPYYGPTSGVYSGGGGGGKRPDQGPAGSGGPGGGGAGGSGNPSGPGTPGVDGSGGGGGGAGEQGAVGAQAGSGGDGVVLVKELNVVTGAPGVWSMQDVFSFKKQDSWTA